MSALRRSCTVSIWDTTYASGKKIPRTHVFCQAAKGAADLAAALSDASFGFLVQADCVTYRFLPASARPWALSHACHTMNQ